MNPDKELHSNSLNNSLDNFFKRSFNIIAAETGDLPIIEYHDDWPSSCHEGKAFLSEEMVHSIHWQAKKRTANNDLSGLEEALDTPLHPDIKTFFTSYWAEQMDVTYLSAEHPEEQGQLTLMFVCNEEDMERLIKNQIGHSLNKIRNKQTLTFFIACTGSDYIISINNESGEVVVERPGYAIEKILAHSLKEFIDQLDIIIDHEEI